MDSSARVSLVSRTLHQNPAADLQPIGMGRRNSLTVLDLYKKDVDALSDFMGNKKYFFDDKVRNIDASVYAILRHLHDQPMKWEGTGYVEGKQNLVDYLERMRKEFNV